VAPRISALYFLSVQKIHQERAPTNSFIIMSRIIVILNLAVRRLDNSPMAVGYDVGLPVSTVGMACGHYAVLNDPEDRDHKAPEYVAAQPCTANGVAGCRRGDRRGRYPATMHVSRQKRPPNAARRA
jgi:hypothetical protein